jgi:hypothetical protein
MKIVVVVEGGCVRTVYCDETADVELIDLDVEAGLPAGLAAAEAKLDLLDNEMVEVF